MTFCIGRHEFMALIGGAAACPLAARAQQPAKPVIGFVSSRSLDGSARHAASFSKGLSETGNVEGQNVMVEYHWLSGENDRLPSANAVCGVLRKMSNHLGYDLFNGCVD